MVVIAEFQDVKMQPALYGFMPTAKTRGGNLGSRTRRLVTGLGLLCAAVVLLALPDLLDLDAPRLYDPTYGRVLTEGFIPFAFALAALVGGVAVLISGGRGR